MKKFSLLLLLIALNVFSGCGSGNNQTKNLKGKIKISGSTALYPLTKKWAEEFRKYYPEVIIELSKTDNNKGMSDVMSGQTDIGMFSEIIETKELPKKGYVVLVAKDAIVAVINDNNPLIQELLNMGISKEIFKNIFISGKTKSWGEIYPKIKNNDKINVIAYDGSNDLADVWAKYLEQKSGALIGTKVKDETEVLTLIKKDPFAIGYINISNAYDNYSKLENQGLKVIPIDINNNQMIDDVENFSYNKDSLLKAIAQNHYPIPPSRELFYVTKGKPSGLALEFIRWILTEGQKFVTETGNANIQEKNIQESLKKLE